MLGRPVGFDSNYELFGSVEEPALTLGLFLVLDVVRLLLPHALDSDGRTRAGLSDCCSVIALTKC